jgi:hypothetical protein
MRAGPMPQASLSGVLLIVFDGITDRLIPLFAVGAFLAFTLSQSGMVAHWWKRQERGAHVSMAVNGLGATATAASRRTPISCPDPTQSAPHAPLQKWDRRVVDEQRNAIAEIAYGRAKGNGPFALFAATLRYVLDPVPLPS